MTDLFALIQQNWNAVNQLGILKPILITGLVIGILLYLHSTSVVRYNSLLSFGVKAAVLAFPFAYSYWLWPGGEVLSFTWGANAQQQYESAGLFGYAVSGLLTNSAIMEN